MIADVLSPILKIISSVLQTVSPILTELVGTVLKPVIGLIKLITTPLDLIAEWCKSEQQKRAEEAAAKANESETQYEKRKKEYDELIQSGKAQDDKDVIVAKALMDQAQSQAETDRAKANRETGLAKLDDRDTEELREAFENGLPEIIAKAQTTYSKLAAENPLSEEAKKAYDELITLQLKQATLLANAGRSTDLNFDSGDFDEQVKVYNTEQKEKILSGVRADSGYQTVVKTLENSDALSPQELAIINADRSWYDQAKGLFNDVQRGKNKIGRVYTTKDYTNKHDEIENLLKMVPRDDPAFDLLTKALQITDDKIVNNNARALGGLVTKPEISLIGEDGREAVLPLTNRFVHE